jgi:hypothetical protein
MSAFRHKLRNARPIVATSRETKNFCGEMRLKEACGTCLLAERFLKLPMRLLELTESRGMVMIDALAIAVATLAIGIPAIMTAAALGSRLTLRW